jgi:glutathionylspermidine synthase
MYVCDFYQTLSEKGGYKDNSSVYIIYAEEEMVCQKYYCPSYLYTSYSITGSLDRVRLSASGIIIKVIIFNNLLRIKKILSLQG